MPIPSARVPQLDIGLTKRDPRWHCERSYQMQLAGGAAELFFIDTNPFISRYHNVSWADQLGARRAHTPRVPQIDDDHQRLRAVS